MKNFISIYRSVLFDKFSYEFKLLENIDMDVSILLLYSIFFSDEFSLIYVRKKIRDIINGITYAYENNLQITKGVLKERKRTEMLEFLKSKKNNKNYFSIKTTFLLAVPACFEYLKDIDKKNPDYLDQSIFTYYSTKSRCLLRNIITQTKHINNKKTLIPTFLNQESIIINPVLMLEHYELIGNYWFLKKKKEKIYCNITYNDVNNALHIIYKQLNDFKMIDNRKKKYFHFLHDDTKDNNIIMYSIHNEYKYFIHLRVNSNFFLSDLDFVHGLSPHIKKYFAEIDSFIIENYKNTSPIIKSFEDERMLCAFLQEEINSYMYQTLLNVQAVYINKEIIFFNNNYEDLILDFAIFKTFLRNPYMIEIRFPMNQKIFFNGMFIKSPYYNDFKKKKDDNELLCFLCNTYLPTFYLKCFHSFCLNCYNTSEINNHLNLNCVNSTHMCKDLNTPLINKFPITT